MNDMFLLVNGSPRRNGTSGSFARTMKGLLEEKGKHVEIVHVADLFNKKVSASEFKLLIGRSKSIGLIVPLYVDFLPYMDVQLLEKLHDDYLEDLKGKNFFAVCQFGFPDVTLGKPLLESCRFFAKSTAMKWLGGLAYGGGAIIDGRNLEDIGKSGRKIISGLRLACEKIIMEKEIPNQAQKVITVRIPGFMYRPLAVFLNHRSKKKAKENGIKDIYARPYLDE